MERGAITELIFQFSTPTETVVVVIEKFSALPSDLMLICQKGLKNFQLQGYFPGHLSFRWVARITNRVSECDTTIHTKIKIHILTGFKLRNIFSNSFNVQILLKTGKMFTPIAMGSSISNDEGSVSHQKGMGDRNSSSRASFNQGALVEVTGPRQHEQA